MSKYIEFEICDSWLQGREDDTLRRLLPVFENLIVLRCEHMFHTRTLQYTAIELGGDPMDPGKAAERVDVIVTVDAMLELTDVRFVPRESWGLPEVELPERCVRGRY